MKHKKRGRVTQLLSRHGRLLVLEVSQPILTQNSRELLSLVPCEYVNRSISICYGNSFAKCANQTSSRVIFSLSPQQGNSEIPRFPPELSDIAGIPKGFPLSIILHIGMHMHQYRQIPKSIGAVLGSPHAVTSAAAANATARKHPTL